MTVIQFPTTAEMNESLTDLGDKTGLNPVRHVEQPNYTADTNDAEADEQETPARETRIRELLAKRDKVRASIDELRFGNAKYPRSLPTRLWNEIAEINKKLLVDLLAKRETVQASLDALRGGNPTYPLSLPAARLLNEIGAINTMLAVAERMSEREEEEQEDRPIVVGIESTSTSSEDHPQPTQAATGAPGESCASPAMPSPPDLCPQPPGLPGGAWVDVDWIPRVA